MDVGENLMDLNFFQQVLRAGDGEVSAMQRKPQSSSPSRVITLSMS
jgi:hypothetical protein